MPINWSLLYVELAKMKTMKGSLVQLYWKQGNKKPKLEALDQAFLDLWEPVGVYRHSGRVASNMDYEVGESKLGCCVSVQCLL